MVQAIVEGIGGSVDAVKRVFCAMIGLEQPVKVVVLLQMPVFSVLQCVRVMFKTMTVLRTLELLELRRRVVARSAVCLARARAQRVPWQPAWLLQGELFILP